MSWTKTQRRTTKRGVSRAWLFGKAFAPQDSSSQENEILVDDDNDEGGGGNALQHLQDDDVRFRFIVFFSCKLVPNIYSAILRRRCHNQIQGLKYPTFNSMTNPIMSYKTQLQTRKTVLKATRNNRKTQRPKHLPPNPLPFPSRSRKKAAWIDPDDSSIQVSLADNKRLRKLRDAPEENVVGGAQYEARLRREFERINPAPEWASHARKKQAQSKKRRRSSAGSGEGDADDDEEAESALLTSTGGIISSKKSQTLAKGLISIERLRDANHSAPTEGAVKAIQFHPSPRIPVLLTVGSDRRLRLFNVRVFFIISRTRTQI